MSQLVSHVNDKLQVKNKILKLPSNRYTGGRNLDAIWHNPNLDTNQCVILNCIAGFIDFRKPKFENQWVFVALSVFEKKTKLSRMTILRLINGDPKRKQKGLVELGYILRQKATTSEQAKKEANDYCLTSKVFDEFVDIPESPTDTPELISESPTDTSGVSHGYTAGSPGETLIPSGIPSEIQREEKRALSDSSNEKTKAGGTGGSGLGTRKTHEALADLLTHRLGRRFENSASKCLVLAFERPNAQIDAGIAFLAKFGQVFTKSDLSSDQSIIACLQSVIDASPEKLEELKFKYLPPAAPLIQNSVMSPIPSSPSMTDEERAYFSNLFKTKYAKEA